MLTTGDVDYYGVDELLTEDERLTRARNSRAS